VGFYILISIPNLYNKTDVILTSETVVPSNLLFIILCISVYFFLKKLSFNENGAFDKEIEEVIEVEDKIYEVFEPEYELLNPNYTIVKEWPKDKENSEIDELIIIQEEKFKELNEFIDKLVDKQLKS
jgi:hypothetical protein